MSDKRMGVLSFVALAAFFADLIVISRIEGRDSAALLANTIQRLTNIYTDKPTRIIALQIISYYSRIRTVSRSSI